MSLTLKLVFVLDPMARLPLYAGKDTSKTATTALNVLSGALSVDSGMASATGVKSVTSS